MLSHEHSSPIPSEMHARENPQNNLCITGIPSKLKSNSPPGLFPLLPFSKEKIQAGDDKWTRFSRNDNYFPKKKTTGYLKQKYLPRISFRQYIMEPLTFFPSFFYGLLVRRSTASRQTSKMQLIIVFLFATPKAAYITAMIFLHIIQNCLSKSFQVFQISLF